MSPLNAVLLGSLHPVALLAGLILKWWTIWFTLGRNFSRTALLSVLAFGSSSAIASLALNSHAAGTILDGSASAGFSTASWVAAYLMAWAALCSLEVWVLRLGLRRMVRSEWSWRNSDLAVYQMIHGVWLCLSLTPLWWN